MAVRPFWCAGGALKFSRDKVLGPQFAASGFERLGKHLEQETK
jgi:hypothetical protein